MYNRGESSDNWLSDILKDVNRVRTHIVPYVYDWYLNFITRGINVHAAKECATRYDVTLFRQSLSRLTCILMHRSL